MKKRFFFFLVMLAGFPLAAQQTGRFYLESLGLEEIEFEFDHDQDGFTTREEYFGGTDPFDAESFLRLSFLPRQRSRTLTWPSEPGAFYQLLSGPTLGDYTSFSENFEGTGFPLEQDINVSLGREFFVLRATPPTDEDDDGLSSREEAILGTRPDLADTDNDLRDDGDEIFIFRSDPLVPDLPGGTLVGRVVTDPNGDGDLADAAPLAAAEVFLDANFNGRFDTGERRESTDEGGTYQFDQVTPGFHHVRQILVVPNVQTKCWSARVRMS